MKWMIDSDFFSERIALHCIFPVTPRDSTGEKRLITLINLLCDSVNGKSWLDAADLSMRLRRPLKQCERVWQLCIEENVLRPVDDGYSAIAWLREKGYFNDDWRNREHDSGQRQNYRHNGGQPRPQLPQQYSKNAF